MDALYNETLRKLDLAFERLEAKVPSPQKTPHINSWVFRYKEKSIHQAMIQKLARQVSGLHAARLLCEKGLLQEHAAVQRILHELHQDTCFLAYAVIHKELTPLHQTYLDAFYKEELDPTTGDGLLDRPTVLRKKIRAYLARFDSEKDPSSAVTIDHTIYSAHSGFIPSFTPSYPLPLWLRHSVTKIYSSNSAIGLRSSKTSQDDMKRSKLHRLVSTEDFVFMCGAMPLDQKYCVIPN